MRYSVEQLDAMPVGKRLINRETYAVAMKLPPLLVDDQPDCSDYGDDESWIVVEQYTDDPNDMPERNALLCNPAEVAEMEWDETKHRADPQPADPAPPAKCAACDGTGKIDAPDTAPTGKGDEE